MARKTLAPAPATTLSDVEDLVAFLGEHPEECEFVWAGGPELLGDRGKVVDVEVRDAKGKRKTVQQELDRTGVLLGRAYVVGAFLDQGTVVTVLPQA